MSSRTPAELSGRLNLAIAVAFSVLTLFFWDSAVLLPVRLFVVFAHEASHAMATWLTGGAVVRLELSAAEGGLCVSQGGSRFVILNAGYLGSLVCGVLFVGIASKTRLDRLALALVATGVILLTLFYMRSGFGFAYGLAAGAVLLLVAWQLPPLVSDLVLRVLGIVSCLYAVWDIGSDVIFRSIDGSDASALSQLTGIPAVLWGGAWLVVSASILLWLLRLLVRSPAKGSGFDAVAPP